MPTYRAIGAAGNRSGFHQAFGNAVMGSDVVTPPIALALNDLVDLILVPGGTRLEELWKYNGDFDTGTTAQYSLGYRTAQPDGVLPANATYFAAAAQTDLQAAVLQSAPTRYAFPAITFQEDVYITMTVGAAATGVSGTPSITTKFLGVMVGIK